MDGQAQVVVTVLEVQDARLLDQLSSQLLLQLHHLLQCPGCQPGLGAGSAPLYCPLTRARGGQPSEPASLWQGGAGRYLECIVGVMQAVDSDVVLEGGAGHGGKQKQLEALGRGHAESLSHQGESAQLLREDIAGAGLQLAVVEVGGCLLAEVQHVLQAGPGGSARSQPQL